MNGMRVIRLLLAATILLSACGALVAPAQGASAMGAQARLNHWYWHADGCAYGHYGDAGYGFWGLIRCDSPELGYIGTDDCYYHVDGGSFRRQICWERGQNSDYLAWVSYGDGNLYTFSRIDGVISKLHFLVSQDGSMIWIEVAPALDPDGWMFYPDYLAYLIGQLITVSDQNNQATAAANNNVILSQQWSTLYSQAYQSIYSMPLPI